MPIQPFAITSTTQFALSNASLHPENFVADLEDAFSYILTFLTFGLVSTVNSSVDNAVNAINQPIALGNLGTLLSSLNAAGPGLVGAGFSECGFSIVNQDTLTLTITHPLDAAPALGSPEAADPDTLFNPGALATMTVDHSQVKPGQTLNAVGADFPFESSDQLTIDWTNTSSGPSDGAEIEYQVVGKTAVTTAAVSGPVNNAYHFTATGLTPNTNYEFKARCSDQLTWSAWTPKWFPVSPAAPKTVQLILQSAGNPNAPKVVVGAADLATASGDWAAVATIPTGTTDGVYTLSAVLSGTTIASVEILVSQTLSAILELWDPTTQTIIPTDEVYLQGGQTFTVKGEGFPGTSPVVVTLDGGPPTLAAGVGGDFTQTLTAPGGVFSQAQVTVTGDQVGVMATLSFNLAGAPQ